MRCLSKLVTRYAPLFFFVMVLLAATACGSDEDETEVGNPTPELAVVVFATEDPAAQTPTATAMARATESVKAETTPTKAPTVGVGISGGTPQQADEKQKSPTVSFPASRPPDENPLTGLQVDDPALLQRRPLMVRVGNDPGARPQVALNEADMIYEEVVEWWVTRFTAIYLSRDPEMIAPIRSARLINSQLTPQYQGALASSGGSDGVRWELSQTNIVDLDEYYVPTPYFYRPNEGWQTRLALDATSARDYLADEGLESKVKLPGFFFSEDLVVKDLPQTAVGDAEAVTIPYPRVTSEARWEYDKKSGKYLRFTTDELMLDFDGDQLAATNVIIYFADHQPTDIVEDSKGATSIRIVINGKGAAWLLRDGKILKGNWETNGQETPMFTFDNGQPMPLKPGNTWVEVIPLEYTIDVDGTPHELEETLPASDETETDKADNTPTTTPSPTLTPIGARPKATPESQ